MMWFGISQFGIVASELGLKCEIFAGRSALAARLKKSVPHQRQKQPKELGFFCIMWSTYVYASATMRSLSI